MRAWGRHSHAPFWATLSLLVEDSPGDHGTFPGGSDSKDSTCNVGDLGSIPGSGRFPWKSHLAYSFFCCEKDFQLNYVSIVYFLFYFHHSRVCIIEDLVLVYVIECSAYVFL